ncbi:MAG: redox-regulated ATPase YchF [Deltaproteobacteria bacterium]|nr:redox-regulated ATPase YchF [Deltaproteobacteria bacterium]MBW2068602.1 redox-regulated ATPase YchF [Deltaproteobacteria bacterium]
MKLGIVGLPRSGKTTLFRALTGIQDAGTESGGKLTPVQGVVSVPDERLDWLFEQFKSKKKTPVQVTYLDLQGFSENRKKYLSSLLNHMRPMDAFVMVIRNFDDPVMGPPSVEKDFRTLEDEFIITDLATVEKRLNKLAEERKKGKKTSDQELELLEQCREVLSKEEPLRNYPEIATKPELRGYTFLSGKPLLIIVNNSDDTSDLPAADFKGVVAIPVRAKLEAELSELEEEDLEVFCEDFGIKTLARDLIIKKSFEILKLVTFYTIGDEEIKAWTVQKGTTALKAAGAIHSDMEKGFIRAEVIHFDDLKTAGNYATARREGLLRLEGKEYIVKDGDILQIRFGL